MMRFIFAGVLFFLSSCAMGTIEIDDLDLALADIHSAVRMSMPLGIREQSSNGREYKSEYFIIKKGEYGAAENAPLKYFASAIILGDRRPYTVKVRVEAQRRDEVGHYERAHYDEGIARVIARKIQMHLHKRRDGRNIIDDFRVF